MPMRVLQHGFAPTVENYGLEPGRWQDMPAHAQFLMDLEFLMRYTPPTGGSCIYCRSPPYLKEIASQFPWIHFYAYQHTDPPPEEMEYDPERPQIICNAPMTVQVHGNTTTAAMEFTNNVARRLGENHGHASRVMICHGSDHTHQLCLHALLRPTFSMLDIQGPIPLDYPEGEIVFPIFIPNNKIFASLVVHQNARCKVYNPTLFQDEIGFFQGVIRVSEAYDTASKDVIASEFARCTHMRHGCPQEILKMGLLCTVDLLQAAQAD